MNAVRIGFITLCAAASVGAWLSLRDTKTPDAPAPQATRASMNPFATSTPGSSVSSADNSSQRTAAATAMNKASELRELRDESDAAEILVPKMTLDELLDVLDADIGEDGEPIDREAVGASLRTDPALTGTLETSGSDAHDN
jgi:hypothetical protein